MALKIFKKTLHLESFEMWIGWGRGGGYDWFNNFRRGSSYLSKSLKPSQEKKVHSQKSIFPMI